MKTIYITTPIYYVNAKPHIGHAYTTIVCDVFARFHKMLGNNVKFVTGTDEHGKKIEQSAINAGIEPQAFTDQISDLFREMLPILNISNNDFIRTTQERHKKAVAAFWTKLYDAGYIYLGEYEGWYDIRNEAYFSDDELVDGKSPLGGDVTLMKEPCYFFKLSQFTDILLKYYDEHPDFIFPIQRKNEIVSFVKSGLKDLAVSRTTFKWGIPVPNDPKHVIYVWLDALVNYLTLNNYPNNLNQNSDEYWKNVHHFVGKEIVRFHAVYWPAFLIAAGINPPKQIISHGWWLSEGEKMSKSIGNVQDPVKYCKLFGSDALRYFVLRELTFGSDGNFSLSGFIARYNSVLANSYGNLCSRVLSFINKYCNSVLETPQNLENEYIEFSNNIDSYLNECIQLIEQYSFSKYLEKIEQAISCANKFVDRMEPWKQKDNQDRLNSILYVLTVAIHKITKYFEPVIPTAAENVITHISIDKNKIVIKTLDSVLFPKIDENTDFDVYEK